MVAIYHKSIPGSDRHTPIGGLGWICSVSAMPSQTSPNWRTRWLPDVFWIGVGLAPVAALMLLLSQGGAPLRVAAVLAIFSVVLIGLSVTLRQDLDGVRVELEESVLEEADAIREETREDIVTVARKIHTALREEVADLAEQVEELREQLAAERAKVAAAAPATNGHMAAAAPATNGHVAAAVSGHEPVVATARVTNGATGAAVSGAAGFGNAEVATVSGRPSPGRARVGPRTGPVWSDSNHAPSRSALPSDGADPLEAPHAGLGAARREYVDPARAAAERRRWDPLHDDLAAAPSDFTSPATASPLAASPVSASPVSASPVSASPVSPGPDLNGGRRRAADAGEPTWAYGGGRRRAADSDEPDDEPTLRELASARTGADPWADLRGDTQPRFGAAPDASALRYHEPTPLDPAWRTNAHH